MFHPQLLSAALDDDGFPALERVMDQFAPEGPYLTFGAPGAARALNEYGPTTLAYRNAFSDHFQEGQRDGVEVRFAGPEDPMVFPPRRFGLVHARWIRFDPNTLANLVRWIRPGGLLLVEAPDDYPSGVLEEGPYSRVAQALASRMRLDSVLDLPARLMHHGLDFVGCEHQSPVTDDFKILMNQLLEQGLPWTELDENDLRDWPHDPASRVPALMNVLAWGTKRN